MRAIRLGILSVLLVLAAAFLGQQHVRLASADYASVHPGLHFWLEVVGAPGCNTESGNATCVLTPGQLYAVNVNIAPLPSDIPSYFGYDAYVAYTGVSLDGSPTTTPWPDCVFSALHQKPALQWFAFGCIVGVTESPPGPLPPSTYTGTLGTFFIECFQPGSLALYNGNGQTDLVRETADILYDPRPSETLTIACGRAPTRPPDVNCDGTVDSRDALLILQLAAHLLDHLPCPDAADANEDGVVDTIDAALVLQVSAGFFDEPPAPPSPTPTETPTPTEAPASAHPSPTP